MSTRIHHDLVIVGAGSGNSMITPEMDNWSIGMVEEGAFGGTCLNRGCIPTKMLVYPADLALQATQGHRLGVSTSFQDADWPAIRDRIFGRVDAISDGGKNYRLSVPNVTVYPARGVFTGPHAMRADDREFTADRFGLAVGARPMIPVGPGLDPTLGPVVPFHTSDTIMRVDELPRHLVIVGGGFIANELAHVFAALGSRVTVINRSGRLLGAQDRDVSDRYTASVSERYELLLGAQLDRVTTDSGDISVHLSDGRSATGDVLLVATGRVANGDLLAPALTGLLLGEHGTIIVDHHGRTSVPGIWSIGDANGRHMLKHMANGEARIVTHNLMHPTDLKSFEQRPAPSAVFAHPQIGTIGLTEQQARDSGSPFVAITHDYGGAAWGWAMEDTASFCKLIGDPDTGMLLGAHVIGSQASTLVSLLVQGMYLGNTIEQMAHDVVYIHPAPSEVIEQALLKLLDGFDTYRKNLQAR